MTPQRQSAMVHTLSVSLHYTDGVIMTSEAVCFSAQLSLSSVPCDGISNRCHTSLYLSIPLWIAIKRELSISHDKQHSDCCNLDLRCPWRTHESKAWSPEWSYWKALEALRGRAYWDMFTSLRTCLRGTVGSDNIPSSCAFALLLLLCNMLSYRRPTAIGQSD